MCAIAGVLGYDTDSTVVQKMLKSMARRGPDDSSYYQERQVSLLHTRLAIIDPVGGRQPMSLTVGEETYVLIYNGELYNTEEIRKELVFAGHRFVGHSDTEVVLHAYAQWNERCVERLNGIFAFAVWQKRAQKLFIARDRIGVKPLFYAQYGKAIVFASEIKTIFAHPLVKPRLGMEGAAQLLLLGPGRLPGSGIFYGVQELEPGCCACYEDGRLQVNRYWKLMDREHREGFEETAEHVRYLVTDAIKRQMVSDVPIGTFLSGGLDSSIISAICARELQKKGELLKTFSVEYENQMQYFHSDKFLPEADNVYIDIMKHHIRSEHHWTTLSSEALIAALEAATEARDLPGMADVDFSLLLFSGQIREHVKVALSGECADEIFGGYPWYRDPEVRTSEGFPWAQNTKLRTSLLTEELRSRMDPESFVMDAYRTTCQQSDILPGTGDEDRRIKEMVNLNFRWFMQTLLDRKDRMSMYHSLEVRVPFCDYRIAEYLYGVPWEYKDYRGQEKGLLRYAMKDLLPDAVRDRKKSPYPKTYDPRYEEMVRNRLEEIQQRDSPLFHLVNRDMLAAYIQNDAPWPWYGQLMRRPQTMAYFIQLDYWLRKYCVEFLY